MIWLAAPCLGAGGSGGSWIVPFVFVTIMVIVMIGNAVSAIRKQQKGRPGLPPSGRGDGEQAGGSLEDWAARRRSELQRVLRQTMGGASSPGDPQPTNLTMAERAERERAKALYQQRAEALRRQKALAGRPGQAAPASPAPPPAPAAPNPVGGRPTPAELARRRMQKAGQISTRAPAAPTPAPARRPPAARPARAAAASPPTVMPGVPTLASHLPPAKESRTAQAARSVHPAEAVVEVEEVAEDAAAAGPRKLRTIVTSGRAMRDVIVLKEILDRPLALRGPEEGWV